MKQTWRICPIGCNWGEWVEISCEYAIPSKGHIAFCDANGNVIAVVTLANTFLVCLENDEFGMRPA